jgi:hypothetical protein
LRAPLSLPVYRFTDKTGMVTGRVAAVITIFYRSFHNRLKKILFFS